MPNAVDGTVSVVVVHEVVLLSDAPDGPERIAQAHVVGLPQGSAETAGVDYRFKQVSIAAPIIESALSDFTCMVIGGYG